MGNDKLPPLSALDSDRAAGNPDSTIIFPVISCLRRAIRIVLSLKVLYDSDSQDGGYFPLPVFFSFGIKGKQFRFSSSERPLLCFLFLYIPKRDISCPASCFSIRRL
jgi:hypothetical protein